MSRNLLLLVVAQALCASAGPLNTFVAGIIGTRLAPSPELSTLPVALLMVGLAVATVPAARWSGRSGRRNAFIGGALIASVASVAAAGAIFIGSFWLFCAATLALGFNQAFVQQYRFAAAEAVREADVGRAVSFVLLGTLVAAFLGPEIGRRATAFGDVPRDAVAYLLLALVTLGGALSLSRLDDAPRSHAAQVTTSVSARSLWKKPGFVLAIAGAGLGYAVMVFVMTATPVSMHVKDGHSMGHTATVIQSHIVAMFLPSLVSGRLIGRFGPVRVMWAGLVAIFLCLAAAGLGRQIEHYWVSLVLLGVGWNFLFVGATSLLVTQYEPELKQRAQAINDFSVFTLAALGSLLSGTVMELFGWNGLLLVALVPTVLLTSALVWHAVRTKTPSTAPTAPEAP